MRAVIVMLLCGVPLLAQVTVEDIPHQWIGENVVVRLVGGEQLHGELLSFTQRDSLDALKLRTAVGTATIDLEQIAEICLQERFYRHNHRLLLMPSAEPVRTNHSVMSIGMLSLGVAVGISDIVSVFALRTIVPAIPSSHQVSLINAKATILQAPFQQLDGYLSVAVGGNLAWLNAPNQLQHVWAAATFTRVRSRLTVLTFYNLSTHDVYQIQVGTFGGITMRYASGAVGFGLGLDVQMPARDDLHVLAELWNSDLTRPYQTMVVVGVRLANTAVCLDAGVGISSLPVVVPLAAVSWTPF